MQSKIIQAFHSRTVGVLIVMIGYDIMAAYGLGLNPQLSSLINLALGGLATYFKMNPSQVYTPAGTPPPVS